MKPLQPGTSVGPALEEAGDITRNVPIGIVVPQIPVELLVNWHMRLGQTTQKCYVTLVCGLTVPALVSPRDYS